MDAKFSVASSTTPHYSLPRRTSPSTPPLRRVTTTTSPSITTSPPSAPHPPWPNCSSSVTTCHCVYCPLTHSRGTLMSQRRPQWALCRGPTLTSKSPQEPKKPCRSWVQEAKRTDAWARKCDGKKASKERKRLRLRCKKAVRITNPRNLSFLFIRRRWETRRCPKSGSSMNNAASWQIHRLRSQPPQTTNGAPTIR